MAPIKFEEHIKDKLEKRSLQPSAEAWDALANRLDAQDRKKTYSMFWFIGVAASVVGIMFVAFQFFDSGTTEKNLPMVVDAPVESEVILEENSAREQVIHEAPVVVSEDLKVKTNTQRTLKHNTEEQTVGRIASHSVIDTKVAIVQKTPLQQTVAINDTAKSRSTKTVPVLSAEDLKVLEVVTQITTLKNEGITVTEDDIDALLKQAEKEIVRERIYNETTRTVDANALLQDVEFDIQKSFRTKVFETLKSGSESLLSAITERIN